MPVYKYLDICSSHITREDAKKLGEGDLPDLMIVRPYQYGWWIWVPDEQDDISGMEEELNKKGFSPAMLGIIRYARKNDCNWINLDADAREESGLPTYDW